MKWWSLSLRNAQWECYYNSAVRESKMTILSKIRPIAQHRTFCLTPRTFGLQRFSKYEAGWWTKKRTEHFRGNVLYQRSREAIWFDHLWFIKLWRIFSTLSEIRWTSTTLTTNASNFCMASTYSIKSLYHWVIDVIFLLLWCNHGLSQQPPRFLHVFFQLKVFFFTSAWWFCQNQAKLKLQTSMCDANSIGTSLLYTSTSQQARFGWNSSPVRWD